MEIPPDLVQTVDVTHPDVGKMADDIILGTIYHFLEVPFCNFIERTIGHTHDQGGEKDNHHE